ncbi:RNA polymerase sigma factor SigX [Peribacillus deserti]|uniref:RNA polymerase sigma factor n=1 Tax=Peribacillus deserti TaxID=673318 RepID=A0A2N5M1Y9_9BACI|nr:RNA polymerase sigma factor SigX [Peribacillus deserti]PLT28293.1 RNA polymerase sigma factor SigX [Peribacillus deserti]
MDSVFQRIYENHHQDLFQFLFYMVNNRETAEDLVQEVYIRVYKSFEQFEGKSSEKTWLYSIARNTAIDHFRKQKSWKQRLLENFDWSKNEIKDEQPLPEEFLMEKEELRFVYESLDHCTVDQKTVIILRYIQDLSITETASVLGWTESKVKTTQHRALKNLKKIINEQSEKGGVRIEKI